MTLNSAIESELPFLRAEAEARFTDTFAAYSPTAGTKDADGVDVAGYVTEAPTKGKVSAESGRGDTESRTINVGGVERLVLTGGLHIPISAAVPTAGEYGTGWEYECIAVGALSDLAVLGTRWLVVDVPLKSNATARRLDVVRLA